MISPPAKNDGLLEFFGPHPLYFPYEPREPDCAGKAAAGSSAGSPAATGGGDSRGAKRRRKQAATKAAGS